MEIECVLKLRDGSRVIRHGSKMREAVLFCGRNQFRADSAIFAGLADALNEEGIGVLYYQMPVEAALQRLDSIFGSQDLAPPLRRFARAFALLAHPDLWLTFLPKRQQRTTSIAFRVDSVARALAALDPKPRFIVGRSAGARVASLVAERTNVRGVICLSYPFRNPDNGDEPERYAHLETLTTPCLIIQGDRDEYGGAEIAGKYPMSKWVTLAFVEADHALSLSEAEHRKVVGLMTDFIGAALDRPAKSAAYG